MRTRGCARGVRTFGRVLGGERRGRDGGGEGAAGRTRAPRPARMKQSFAAHASPRLTSHVVARARLPVPFSFFPLPSSRRPPGRARDRRCPRDRAAPAPRRPPVRPRSSALRACARRFRARASARRGTGFQILLPIRNPMDSTRSINVTNLGSVARRTQCSPRDSLFLERRLVSSGWGRARANGSHADRARGAPSNAIKTHAPAITRTRARSIKTNARGGARARVPVGAGRASPRAGTPIFYFSAFLSSERFRPARGIRAASPPRWCRIASDRVLGPRRLGSTSMRRLFFFFLASSSSSRNARCCQLIGRRHSGVRRARVPARVRTGALPAHRQAPQRRAARAGARAGARARARACVLRVRARVRARGGGDGGLQDAAARGRVLRRGLAVLVARAGDALGVPRGVGARPAPAACAARRRLQGVRQHAARAGGTVQGATDDEGHVSRRRTMVGRARALPTRLGVLRGRVSPLARAQAEEGRRSCRLFGPRALTALCALVGACRWWARRETS